MKLIHVVIVRARQLLLRLPMICWSSRATSEVVSGRLALLDEAVTGVEGLLRASSWSNIHARVPAFLSLGVTVMDLLHLGLDLCLGLSLVHALAYEDVH